MISRAVLSLLYVLALLVSFFCAYKFLTVGGWNWSWFITTLIWSGVGAMVFQQSHFYYAEENDDRQ